MVDRYQRFIASRFGDVVTRRPGLPRPTSLRRHQPGHNGPDGPVVLAGTDHAQATAALHAILAADGAHVHACGTGPPSPDELSEPAALLVDATGLTCSTQLGTLHGLLHGRPRCLRPCAWPNWSRPSRSHSRRPAASR